LTQTSGRSIPSWACLWILPPREWVARQPVVPALRPYCSRQAAESIPQITEHLWSQAFSTSGDFSGHHGPDVAQALPVLFIARASLILRDISVWIQATWQEALPVKPAARDRAGVSCTTKTSAPIQKRSPCCQFRTVADADIQTHAVTDQPRRAETRPCGPAGVRITRIGHLQPEPSAI